MKLYNVYTLWCKYVFSCYVNRQYRTGIEPKSYKFMFTSGMRMFVVVLLLSVQGIKAVAQTADANAIIEKTSLLYKQSKGMDILFAANIRSDKNSISESFEGIITMKNDKFILKTPDMMVWFDGVTQWTYITRNKEVNISTPSGDDLRMLNPMALLQDYKKDFNVSYIGESTSSNAKISYDVALIPKKKDDIEKIEIQIEKSTSLPAKLVVMMSNDIRNTVTIKEIKEINPSDGIFVFPKDDYPDAEIIDLR